MYFHGPNVNFENLATKSGEKNTHFRLCHFLGSLSLHHKRLISNYRGFSDCDPMQDMAHNIRQLLLFMIFCIVFNK